MSVQADVESHLEWLSVNVQGRVARYGLAGDGLPVLFLHGWALGPHTYKRALKRLVIMGCKVIAPALPGFGGTADLPSEQVDLAGYARWVSDFLDALEVKESVMAVGHSFGGAVATQLAHDHPRRVGYLVLINSVGGSAWRERGDRVFSMAERPLWDWGVRFPLDLLPLKTVWAVLSVILEDAGPNLLRNPLAVWRAAYVARTADLTVELSDLKDSELPILVLWGEDDHVIPRASFESLCAAIGSEGELVPGHHSWLLADPDEFGQVMSRVLGAAGRAIRSEQPWQQVAAGATEEAMEEAIPDVTGDTAQSRPPRTVAEQVVSLVSSLAAGASRRLHLGHG